MDTPQKSCENCGSTLPVDAPESLCPRCTFASMAEEMEAPSPLPEIQIPGLTILEEMGEGGFGIVYLADQTGTFQRKVAVKILKAGLDTRQVLRRFEIEQKALALLEHPNIARIYEAGETDKGYPFFTMEYIEGDSITQFLEGKTLPEILSVLLAVCSGISHAHSKGVIHRDLKPSNILITRDGIPKVIDFGIAKATDPKSAPGMTQFTGSDTWLGTPAYMAPELATGGSLNVDNRTDIYSLGAILYELLTGKTPLEAATGQCRHEDLATHRIPKPSRASGSEIPAPLERITLKALAHDPADRYATVDEFSDDLRRFQAGEKISARRPASRIKTAPAIVALLLVLAGFFTWFLQSRSQPEPTPPAPRSVNAFHPIKGRASTPLLSPDHSRSLVIFPGGNRSLLLDSRSGEKIASFSFADSQTTSGCFNDDGTELALGKSNGTVSFFRSSDGQAIGDTLDVTPSSAGPAKLINIIGKGPNQKLVTQNGDSFELSFWSPDGTLIKTIPLPEQGWKMAHRGNGTHLVLGSKSGRIYLLDCQDYQLIESEKIHSSGTTGLFILPDDSGYLSCCFDSLAVVWDWKGHKIRSWKTGGKGRSNYAILSPDSSLLATGNNDGFARVFDVATGEALAEFTHPKSIFGVGFSPDNKVLTASCADKKIYFWSLNDRKPARPPWLFQHWAWAAILTDGPGENHNILATATNHGIHILSEDELPD